MLILNKFRCLNFHPEGFLSIGPGIGDHISSVPSGTLINPHGTPSGDQRHGK
jgi:hypothetical protein